MTLFHHLALHTHRTEGAVGMWDRATSRLASPDPIITGTAGEILKHFVKVPFDFANDWRIIDLVKLYHPYDPLGIVSGEIKNSVEVAVTERLSKSFVNEFEPPEFADLFYIMNRMPGWLSSLNKGGTYSGVPVSPLNSPALIRLAFSVGYKQRKIFRPHYELMKLSCRQLTEVPFGNDTWSPELEAYGAPASIFQPACTSSAPMPTQGSWQHTLNKSGLLRTKIINFISDCRNDPLFDFVDVAKLLDILQKKPLTVHEMISLFGVLVALCRSIGMETFLPISPKTHVNNYPLRVRGARELYNLDYGEKIHKMEDISHRLEIHVDAVVVDTFHKAQKIGVDYVEEGFVDDISHNFARGWAYLPEFPMIRPTVEVCLADKVVARGSASKFSRHLKAANKGDGRYEFQIPLDLPPDQKLSSISVRFGDTQKILKHSQKLAIRLAREGP